MLNLQHFPFQASVQSVRDSVDFQSYDEFYSYLLEHLPQNSPHTRKRYADLIGERYFPGASLNALLPETWRSYRDERILVDLMRVFVLEAEPVIARFLVDEILPLDPAHVLDPSVIIRLTK